MSRKPDISWSDVIPLLHKWGIDPNRCASVTWLPDRVEVLMYQLDADGHKFVAGDDVATYTLAAPKRRKRG